MSDGTRLAIAILVMWLAMVFFFFAFHPNGVAGADSPIKMLQWLVDHFSGNVNQSNTPAQNEAGQVLGVQGIPPGVAAP